MGESRRIAIVTGAGSGIGRAVALALQAAGYNVVLAGRRLAELKKTEEGLNPAGGKFKTKVTDVTDPLAVRALFQAAKETFGRVDVLFNNAGTGAPAVPFDELTDDQWQSVVDVNLSGTFYCCREAFSMMKEQDPKGGRIINNGSVSSFTPRPLSAPYTATKHAISGLTKSLALDGRAHDIACSQIDIGNAETELTKPMAKGILQADGSTKAEPRIDVAHVASAVVYMASLPLDANILFMTLKATKMPFEGRG